MGCLPRLAFELNKNYEQHCPLVFTLSSKTDIKRHCHANECRLLPTLKPCGGHQASGKAVYKLVIFWVDRPCAAAQFIFPKLLTTGDSLRDGLSVKLCSDECFWTSQHPILILVITPRQHEGSVVPYKLINMPSHVYMHIFPFPK